MASELSPEFPEIRPSPETFRDGSNGCTYRLVQRTGRVALYHASRDWGDGFPPTERWEVHLVRVKRPHPRDQDRRFQEILASASEFGKYGWNYMTHSMAIEKFARMVQTGGGNTCQADDTDVVVQP